MRIIKSAKGQALIALLVVTLGGVLTGAVTPESALTTVLWATVSYMATVAVEDAAAKLAIPPPLPSALLGEPVKSDFAAQ